jgi:hypothetical protein
MSCSICNQNVSPDASLKNDDQSICKGCTTSKPLDTSAVDTPTSTTVPKQSITDTITLSTNTSLVASPLTRTRTWFQSEYAVGTSTSNRRLSYVPQFAGDTRG